MTEVKSKIKNWDCVGYFLDGSDKPVYDPPLDCDCLVCGKRLDDKIRTNTLLGLASFDHCGGEIVAIQRDLEVCYFWRMHASCAEMSAAVERVDGDIVDAAPFAHARLRAELEERGRAGGAAVKH